MLIDKHLTSSYIILMSKNKVPQFGLRIPPNLRDELEEFCKSQEKTLTQVILDAIRFYLNNH